MKKHFIKIKNQVSRGRFFLLAAVFAVTATLGSIPISKPAHAAIGTITEYTIPTSQVYPQYLTVGPDNNIWYTGRSRIGKLTTSGSLTQYLRPSGSTPSYQYGITKGSDNNVWFGEAYSSSGSFHTRIVKVSTNGTVLGQYDIPSGQTPLGLTLGTDGNVWFTEQKSKIGMITPSGTITEYSVPSSATAQINDITSGPDGNLWFTIGTTGDSYGKIGKITTAGVVTEYSIPTYSAVALDITTGSDGNLWFTENGANKIGKITPAGALTEYSNSSTGLSSSPIGITTGSDGALWITEYNSKIARMTTSATVTNEYSIPSAPPSGSLEQIIAGPDGAAWYANYTGNSIGRIATELTHQTVSFTSTAPANANLDSSPYVPTASATSGLPVAITVDASSSSVCSIDGSGNVTYQAAGTCTLNANQGGNIDYAAAAQVQQSFTVLPVNADTSVALSCPSTALVGTSVTCTITVTNNGPAAAQNASLTALFANSFTSVSVSGGTLSGQTVTWSTPSLASGDSATITVTGTATTPGKARFNAALLQTSPDPNISNNIVASTVVIS